MESDRKTQIIKTAVKRFARHGLNKTTLEEIARDIRIGKATIYHYFKSKEALFYQALEYDASNFIEEVKQILNNEQLPVKERINEYINFKQDIYSRYQLLYDLMLMVLKEDAHEKEKEILKNLLNEEEGILKQVLDTHYNSSNNLMNSGLPKFFTLQSWGILFGKKLNDVRQNGILENPGDILFLNLENIIKLE